MADYVLPIDDASGKMQLALHLYGPAGINWGKFGVGKARRDARLALRAFRYEVLDRDSLLAHGARPFLRSPRARVGLSDGTPEAFRGYTGSLLATPGYKFVGAWCGDQLAAYMWILMIDDWAAVAAYAANDHLRSCPNNGLLHFALDYCLSQGRCREVTYGLSSIQEIDRTASLDYFKKKVGFESRPVPSRIRLSSLDQAVRQFADKLGRARVLEAAPTKPGIAQGVRTAVQLSWQCAHRWTRPQRTEFTLQDSHEGER